MGDRMTCPICDSHTSSVLIRFREGRACPYCEAPAALMAEVEALKVRKADAAAVARLAEMGKELAAAKKKNRVYEVALREIQHAVSKDALEKALKEPSDDWY